MVSLEYDDTVILTFTPENPLVFANISQGEYVRDTAVVNIIDSDRKLLQLLY